MSTPGRAALDVASTALKTSQGQPGTSIRQPPLGPLEETRNVVLTSSNAIRKTVTSSIEWPVHRRHPNPANEQKPHDNQDGK